MRWLKRFAYLLLLLPILFMGTGLFVNWKYADDLEAYVLESIRSAIETDISISDDAEFSLWKDFPLVAVELKDLYVQDSFKTDTLLSAKSAFAQLNILKILRNDFTIEGIRLKDGFFRLRRNEAGDWNFRVWKDVSSSEGEKPKTDFGIEILTLENIYLDYDDRDIDLNIQFLSEKSKLKGRFTDGNQRLGMSLKGFMPVLNTAGDDRIVELPLNLAGVLNINSTDRVYTVEMGNAILAGNEMVWDATWRKVDEGTHLSLKIHAGNIDPEVLLPHVWPQIPEAIVNLQLKGKSDLIVTMEGPFTKTNGPQLDAVIRMRNGHLKFQDADVRDLNFESKLYMKDVKRSKSIQLTFDKFDLKTKHGSVAGKGTLVDLEDPVLNISTTGTSRIEEILSVAKIKEGISGKGDVSWNLDFSGPLGHEFNTTNEELKNMNWSGSVSFSNAELILENGTPPIRNLHGKVTMSETETDIKECSGSVGHLDFAGDIRIKKLKQILTDPNFPVDIEGSIQITEMDLIKLPAEWDFSTSANSSAERSVNLDLVVELDNLSLNNFTAQDLIGNLSVKDNVVSATDLNINALGGRITGDLEFKPMGNGYSMHIISELRNIDISRLLSEWDEFGQTSITSKHLKGKASAKMDITAALTSDYQLIREQLKVESDLEISGGELIKFEPLMAMSKFISVDELSHVKFDTLRNHLSIVDDKLIIPNMSVSSSILNVDVFGEHSFDQELDYHVNLLLNDLLRRKAKKTKTFEGHEILDNRGKTRLYLWIRGTPGNIKVGYDKKEVRKKVKQDLKTEGKTIKRLFQEEFGGAKSEEVEKPAVQFKLEERETSTIVEEEVPAEEKPKKKRGFFNDEPEKEETEGGFEIEFDP